MVITLATYYFHIGSMIKKSTSHITLHQLWRLITGDGGHQSNWGQFSMSLAKLTWRTQLPFPAVTLI